tara:strand:+ start:5622 stop:5774 length:153 start_codon:yes stop_codon:yes gene_type:complete
MNLGNYGRSPGELERARAEAAELMRRRPPPIENVRTARERRRGRNPEDGH